MCIFTGFIQKIVKFYHFKWSGYAEFIKQILILFTDVFKNLNLLVPIGDYYLVWGKINTSLPNWIMWYSEGYQQN